MHLASTTYIGVDEVGSVVYQFLQNQRIGLVEVSIFAGSFWWHLHYYQFNSLLVKHVSLGAAV